MIIISFFLKTQNICFNKQLLKKDDELVLFSEFYVSQIHFKLTSIKKNQSLNVQGFTVFILYWGSLAQTSLHNASLAKAFASCIDKHWMFNFILKIVIIFLNHCSETPFDWYLLCEICQVTENI